MEFRVLGALDVQHDGRAVPLGAHQQRALLAMLVLNAGEVVSVDRLIDGLWGAEPPATAAKTVHVYVSRLRKALSAAAVDGRSGELIVTRDHGYMLRVDPASIDLRVFERLLDEGRRAMGDGAHQHAAGVLREALALWRGEPLAEFTFDHFAGDEIARLQELRLEALESRIDADLALGRHTALVAELEGLTTRHPLRERLRGQRMLALYRSGRQSDALAVYRQTRRTLVDELGIEPGARLRELHEAILRQDPSLEPPRALPQPPSKEGGAGRFSRVRLAFAAVAFAATVAAAIAALSHGQGSGSGLVDANAVAVIDPTHNAVVREVAVGVRPADISAGDGGLWVANLDDDTVSQIDPHTERVTRTLSTGTSVDALATGPGAVWTLDYLHATATRIDPAFHQVVRRFRVGPDPYPATTPPSPVAVGGDSTWAATGGAAIARVAPRSGHVERIDVGTEPAAIAVGDGATWVADDLDDTVTRIDPAGTVTATLPVGHGASGIAAGAGAVWVSNTQDDTVTRIDADTNATRTRIPVGAAPRGIALDPRAVWVANSGDGTVSRIDPRTDRVTSTIKVGGSPEGIAAAAGRIWVTVQAGPPPPGVQGAPGSLRVVQEKDFNSTDPALLAGYGPQAGQLAFATCAKLLNYPDRPAPEGTRLTPEVAASMPTVSPDGRVYKFTIRPGFRFSPPSNQPVTGQAFRRALERFLSPRMQPDDYPPAFMSDIAGFRAYRSGKARHLAGVTATDTTLTIQLVRAAPTLPARLAMPFFCAVPPNTPIRPGGVEGIPAAGPYYVAWHNANHELVLRRNPNYHGPRPHRPEAIDYRFGPAPTRAVALVDSGHAEYANATIGDQHFARAVPPALQASLDRRYGPHSGAARAGRQRYFINRTLAVLYLLLDNRRPLFANARTRRAVNFAVDRAALARNVYPTSATPTDQYLPTGMPGFRDADIYPLGGPNLVRARQLAARHGGRAVMFTCNTPDCLQRAEIVKTDLQPIGIKVHIRQFPLPELFRRENLKRPGFDIGMLGWAADYADPFDFIGLIFGPEFPGTIAPRDQREITEAASLTGQRRLRAYGQIDIDLATHAAPAIAFANVTAHDFFSDRIGCQTFQPIYGMDLGSLCRRDAAR